MSKKGGLGRGLGALIPVAASVERAAAPPAPVGPGGPVADAYPRHDDPDRGWTAAGSAAPASAAGRLREIALTAITANPRQPRQVFDEDALADLAASIREVGLLQPVVVRPVTEGTFELVMGERRWRAAALAGLETIPALVRETADDALLRDALLENIQREQLNPLEEAAAYAQLLDDFGATHEDLARRLGRSRSHVSNTLRLLQLTPAVQRRVAAGVLTAGHARAVLAVPGPDAQERLAARIVAEGMSVRQAEEAVALGDGGGDVRGPRRLRQRPALPPDLAQVAQRLSDLLDTRVSVQVSRSRGRLTVEFASPEDLDRILSVITSGGQGSPADPQDPPGAPGTQEAQAVPGWAASGDRPAAYAVARGW